MSRSCGHDMTSREFGMRALLAIQAYAKAGRTLADYVNVVIDRLGVSRATAYRAANEALDCLCIVPAPCDQSNRSTQRFASRTAEPRPHLAGMLT